MQAIRRVILIRGYGVGIIMGQISLLIIGAVIIFVLLVLVVSARREAKKFIFFHQRIIFPTN